MTGWAALGEELDRWSEAGRSATFWWRDDDAVAPSAALDRLLALTGDRGLPVALAVVPAGATTALAARLERAPNACVLVHGYAHANHAPAGQKKCEFGAQRQPRVVSSELADALARLADLMGPRLRPVLVPPWNRLAERWLPELAALRYRGLSRYLARARPDPATGLRAVNAHVDIIDWQGGRGFLGSDAALRLTREHLEARRRGSADADEPTGLLTHHLEHDDACWAFLAHLTAFLAARPAARWVDVDAAFGLGA